MHQSVVNILTQQISYELASSNLYLQMSNWCRMHGFVGTAAFFHKHATEEYFHMKKIWNFLQDNGIRPTVGTTPAPKTNFSSLHSILAEALEHERFVTKTINDCVEAAVAVGDHKTINMLQWFVNEQVEEENLFNDIMAKFEVLGTDGLSLFHIDQDIAELH